MCRIVTLALVLLTAGGFGITPLFDAPVALEASGVPINVGAGGNASPYIVDWDGDGRQDLLLGQYSGGRIRFYRNVGEHFAPEFANFVYLQADGVDISVSSG